MKPNLIISAGGTGGHIFPALAVARLLEDKFNIIWVGANVGLETQIIPKHGYQLETISIGGIRNKGLLRKVMLPFTLMRAFLSCGAIILKHRPKTVVGFGGYATFPICVVAKLFAKPVVIHEQNSVAGLTNKVLAKFAKRILTAFPAVLSSPRTIVVGNPVRDDIIKTGKNKEQDEEKDKVSENLRILIIGGSLGAKALNDYVPLALAKSSCKFSSIVHQVGRGDKQIVSELYLEYGLNATVVSFIDDMAQVYANTDLVICRAGASTVAEICCAGLAAIFVPYPFAVDDHQTKNAKYLADNDAAILLRQEDLTSSPQLLVDIINELDVAKCNQIANRAREMAIIDSTEQICEQILGLV